MVVMPIDPAVEDSACAISPALGITATVSGILRRVRH